MSAAQEAHLAGAAASYRGLFAEPWARWLALADVCARLPQGMVSITLLLVAAQHASMRVAGLVLAGYTLAQAASGPRRGRLADRHGLGPAAALCTLGYTLAPLGLLSAASAGLLTGTAVAAGLLNPPLSPGMRSLWSTNAGARFKQTAFALDAAVFDLAYITGPVLPSVLATGLAPAAAVAVLLALTGAAVLTIVTPSRRLGNGKRKPAPASASRRSPLRSAALRELLVTAALTNVALTATEVALTAYVRHHHALWASGPPWPGSPPGGPSSRWDWPPRPRPPLPSARTTIRSAQISDGTAAERYFNCPAPSEGGRGGGRGSGVSSWTPQRVLDAAAAMEWVPGGAIELRTDDYRLIRYPDVVLDPTFRAAQVTWSRTKRPLEEIIGEIAAYARVWGVPGVAWWVSAATEPAQTEDVLRARDAELIDAVQVLARELGGGLPELDVPDGVVVELVRDERTFRASSAVSVQGWGRTEPDEAELARQLDETLDNLASWSSFRVVALVGDVPVCTGGCTLAGEVAQLWGSITLPASRGRGSYRAVLAERLRLAREHGATLALVKGRVLSSGPILLRAGFADYGEERCYWLPVS